MLASWSYSCGSRTRLLSVGTGITFSKKAKVVKTPPLNPEASCKPRCIEWDAPRWKGRTRAVHYEIRTNRLSEMCRHAPRATKGVYRFAKVVVEWLAAASLLLIAAPMVGLPPLPVCRASPGPAFYSQIRLGKTAGSFGSINFARCSTTARRRRLDLVVCQRSAPTWW